MANATRHNPEATSWRGKSYKKGGSRIAELRMEERFDSKAAQKLYEDEMVAEVGEPSTTSTTGTN